MDRMMGLVACALIIKSHRADDTGGFLSGTCLRAANPASIQHLAMPSHSTDRHTRIHGFFALSS